MAAAERTLDRFGFVSNIGSSKRRNVDPGTGLSNGTSAFDVAASLYFLSFSTFEAKNNRINNVEKD